MQLHGSFDGISPRKIVHCLGWCHIRISIHLLPTGRGSAEVGRLGVATMHPSVNGLRSLQGDFEKYREIRNIYVEY